MGAYSVSHLLDLPHKEKLACSGQLDRLIGFSPGKRLYHTALDKFLQHPIRGDVPFSSFFPGPSLNLLVDKPTLDRVEDLLRSYSIEYSKDLQSSVFRLCCDTSTFYSSSLHFLNCPGEHLLLVSTPDPLYLVYVRFFIDRFTEEEKGLERKLIQAWIDHRGWVIENGVMGGDFTSLEMYPSRKAAEESLKCGGSLQILRAYQDGCVVVGFKGGLPLSTRTISSMQIPSCGVCEESIIKEKAANHLSELAHEFASPAAFDTLYASTFGSALSNCQRDVWADFLRLFGYRLDTSRIKFKVRKKHLVPVISYHCDDHIKSR